ncbi:GDSL esterase/lipase [Iris pallida]|uniref:GDSL esterase/lipase n=1 Tax=Iris pallida TaxID=29817 RepID=A0AAX6FK21_IRIPA|nr:GDSL esterase/lipase [Iris pallida]
MRRAKEKILAAVTVLVLLSLLAILKLVIRTSLAFNLVGSIHASLVLVVLSWALAVHYLHDESIISITGLILVASAVAPILVSLAVLLCVRFRARSSLILLLFLLADLVLILFMVSSFVAPKVAAAFCTRNSSADEDSELDFAYLGRVGGVPKRFRYEELKLATNDFRDLIGRGGSGSVFKGFLDGLPVAVKRIEGELHGEREFRSELNAILSVQHASLVRIFGYCLASGGHRFLVCEFLENGSLDAWIFPGAGAREVCLSWALRYQVAVDVAKALAYLHDDCRSRILHLDVKPQNILLDGSFRACVSDFGISRMMGEDESRVITTIRGTRGYLAPEWFTGGGISEKSDVYSYGMVLLELVGGRRNWAFVDDGAVSQRTWFYLPKFVSEKMREGKVMEAVDGRLAGDGRPEEEEVRVLVYVALWCIQERAELRPSMELVVSMLKGHVAVGVPPETRMFLVDEYVVPLGSGIYSTDSSRTRSSTGRSQYPVSSAQSFSVSTPLCR